MPFTLEDSEVRSPKTGVAQSVAHRVDRRVNVAQVVKEIPQLRRDPGTRRRHRF